MTCNKIINNINQPKDKDCEKENNVVVDVIGNEQTPTVDEIVHVQYNENNNDKEQPNTKLNKYISKNGNVTLGYKEGVYEEEGSQNKKASRAEKKKNKKVVDLSYIIHYNRYQPIKREIPKKKNANTFVKKNINQYINCNFRYYVSEKDYLMQNTIGENVNWEKIEKVDYIVPQETTLSCPICLENNIISPRITKCRHIFCFFCILKYFIQEEKKTWKKCPICFEIIIEKDLRIVKFQYVKNYNINDCINLCLLYTDNKKIHLHSNTLNFNNSFKITNDTFLGKGEKEKVEKCETYIDYVNKDLIHISKKHTEKIEKLNLNFGVQFFKLFYIYNPLALWLKDLYICNIFLNKKKMNAFVSEEYVINEAKERIQLQICNYLNIPTDKFQADLFLEDGRTDCFYLYDNLAHNVYDSIEKIKREMEQYNELVTVKTFLKEEEEQKRETIKNQKTEEEKSDNKQTDPVNSNNMKDWNRIYFYQCIEGQYIYLDPFILKLLFYEYNYDVDELPKFLYNKKITYINSFELDDKMRKKHCILSHLPLGVNVLFISICIDDLLSKRTKEHFSKEISFVKAKHYNFLKRKKHEERHFDLLAMETIQKKEQDYWNLANNKIVIKESEHILKPQKERPLFFPDQESYIYNLCEEAKGMNYDEVIIEGQLIRETCDKTKHDITKCEKPRGTQQKKKCDRNKDPIKKKEDKGEKLEKMKKNTLKANNKSCIKTSESTEPQKKKTFLDIAKATCNINMSKKQELEKKEEKFSLGSGILSISLLDLINNQKIQKKKKKKKKKKNNKISEKETMEENAQTHKKNK